jgi:succinyl-diaminopimelate desuccinylase
VPAEAELDIVSNAEPARVVVESAFVRALQAAGALAVGPKQAWTNVADFTARGIPAVNFGPGATRYAHRRDELVEIASLERAYAALRGVALGESSVV